LHRLYFRFCTTICKSAHSTRLSGLTEEDVALPRKMLTTLQTQSVLRADCIACISFGDR
jgi:hypothetical protein